MKNTNTNTLDDVLPPRILFPLKELDSLGILKVSMAKKLLSQKLLESIKIGSKHFIARTEILRYLIENTIARVDSKDNQ